MSVASSSMRGLSVAPMMKQTHRHHRFLMRLLTKRTLLYTEMRVDKALIFGKDRESLLGFSHQEHPIALQLGGSEVESLCQAAQLGEDYGYDEINLNAGCPSDRVSAKGCFGAALMKDPDHLSSLLYKMNKQVQIPVSVKCRLGVDDLDSYEYIHSFMSRIQDAGIKRVTIHARKCILKGLSTRENRSIPPLKYPWVLRLARDFPELEIGINGGITTIDQAYQLLTDGHNMYAPGGSEGDADAAENETYNFATRVPLHDVMIGRAAWSNPVMFADADRRIYGQPNPGFTRREIIEQYADYIATSNERSLRLSSGAIGPLIHLFYGCIGSTKIRGAFEKECMPKGKTPAELATAVRDVMREIPTEYLDEPLAPVESQIENEGPIIPDAGKIGTFDSLASKSSHAIC